MANLNGYDKNNLFAHVQLLTYDDQIHPLKFIVPPKTIVQDIEKQVLIINDFYGCDLNNKTILYPLNEIKCDNCEITFVFNLFFSNQNSRFLSVNLVLGYKSICLIRINKVKNLVD